MVDVHPGMGLGRDGMVREVPSSPGGGGDKGHYTVLQAALDEACEAFGGSVVEEADEEEGDVHGKGRAGPCWGRGRIRSVAVEAGDREGQKEDNHAYPVDDEDKVVLRAPVVSSGFHRYLGVDLAASWPVKIWLTFSLVHSVHQHARWDHFRPPSFYHRIPSRPDLLPS